MIVLKKICDQLSDVEIVQKSLMNVEFFSCLFERYEAQLSIYIRRTSLVTNEEADDILQESFIKIWRNLNSFDTGLKLSSWLYRIVHNQTISYWRKKVSYGKANIDSLDENIFVIKSDDNDLFGGQDELNQNLPIALQKIPVNYREILILRFYENLSYLEISDILKIPEGTVAIRLRRAKKVLLTEYKKIQEL